MISTIDFVFLKLWLLWHGKIYSDRCWPVDIPWSFCIVLLLVRLNVSMAIVQGFTVSWYQWGKRCGKWKNCTSFQEFILKKWTSEVWKKLEVRDMVGKFVGNEAANCRKTLWSTGTWRKRHSTENWEWARLLWFIYFRFRFFVPLVKCTGRLRKCWNKWHVMTTDDKWLTSAIFVETTVELKWVLEGQRTMDGTSCKDSSGSICCPFFAKDQLELVRMLS